MLKNQTAQTGADSRSVLSDFFDTVITVMMNGEGFLLIPHDTMLSRCPSNPSKAARRPACAPPEVSWII